MKFRKNECIGCYNIRERNFPIDDGRISKEVYYLDTEGCWYPVDEDGKSECYYQIYFCPVCGVKLST